ncbi:MAG: YceI family protein [Anaerolineae bacterium]|nr:YceI family protein [Anaerolineae bacterium]
MSRWKIECGMSRVHFSIPYLLFSQAEGCFDDVSGSLNYDPYRPESASVEARIKVASLHSPQSRIQAFLRNQLLNAQCYPEITFRSDRVRILGDDHARITGKLTIRKVTYPVTFEAAQFAEDYDADGHKALQFNANAVLSRDVFDLDVHPLINLFVGHSITISLDVMAVLQTEQAYP